MAQINLGSTKVKKIYVGGTQVKKVYVGSNRVYSADVVLTNQVGGSKARNWQTLDAGVNQGSKVAQTYTTVPGHKYFVRAAAGEAGSWTWGPTSAASVGGVQIASLNGPNNQMLTASGTSMSAVHSWSGSCTAGTYSGVYADFYMFVDVTELEEALGVTFTAATFWSMIGSTEFYNTKTIEI